jgi:hypothetical protein
MEIYVNAIVKKCEADRAIAVANLNTYLKSPVGVGEHPNIVGEVEKLLGDIATADGKLEALKSLISSNPPADNVAESK